MIAALPMYDRPELRAAHDALWNSIATAARLRRLPAPVELTRNTGVAALWERPDLLLGQTCGMPYRTRLHGRVSLVATLDYGVPGAPPGYYRSVLVARRGHTRDDYREATLAYNAPDSQSGWAAAVAAGLGQGLLLETGAHVESAGAVVEGRADVAALDAVTWQGIQRFEPSLASSLEIVGTTDPTPGLPLITADGSAVPVMQEAVQEGVAMLDRDSREALGLVGVAVLPASAYLAVPTPPPPA